MNNASPGKLTLMVGAAVTFIFSFLPWFSAGAGPFRFTMSAWKSGAFPMATWAPVLALIAGFIVAAEAFGFVKLPEKLWEFTQDQVVLILSVFAFIVTVSYLIMDKGGASISFGLILCFLGTIAMIAGFFMDRAGVGVNPNAVPGGAMNQPPMQQPPMQQPPMQQPPMQQPPVQQPPAQQPPQQDPGAF